MSTSSRVRAELRRRIPIRNVPTVPHEHLRSTWKQARPGRIRASFDVAQSQDPGGWYVVGTTQDVRSDRSVTRTIAGREVVLWRDETGGLLAGPGTCPHLGALLDDCEVIRGDVVCRWHGMALGATGRAGWLTFPAYDDGALAWVQLPAEGETPTDRPTIPVARRLRRRSRPSSPSPARASRRTSSPTGSTRGTGPGTTRMRSATSSSTTTRVTTRCSSST